jgi:ATP-dependent DNA helicase RecQ
MTQPEAEKFLRAMLGDDARFREGQWEAVDRVANRRQRLLVVQRTGWGKSIVYFLATKILRGQGAGPTLVISPLLSLMRNQIAATEKIGLRAFAIHSENRQDWEKAEAALRDNACDLLMIAPERLGNREFLERILPLFQGRSGLLVVDEAHCISDWGHDFRPDYRRIVRILRHLPANLPVLCTTATANNRVVQDVLQQIPSLRLLRGPLTRHSLRLFNLKLDGQAERLAWLAHFVPQLPGSGVIYCLTIDDTRRVAAWLKHKGIEALDYSANLEADQRVAAEEKLLKNEIKALVATVALGMGFDKPDLGFVIHFQRPGSVVAYYQQVGRAGRAVETAYGILLSGVEDDEIQEYFIRTAFPPPEVMQAVLGALERHERLSLPALSDQLNYSWGALEKALKLLEVDGAVERTGSVYCRTANPWQPNPELAERVTRLRRAELEQIRQYVSHSGCLMEFLAKALDDPHPAPCGRCMNCTGKTQRQTPPEHLLHEATTFLRGDTLVLSPRERWPAAAVEDLAKALPAAVEKLESGKLKVAIAPAFRLQEGRALCIYGDAGWGIEVARGKYETGRFGDELAEAVAGLVRDRWRPSPMPVWATVVPSLRRGQLMRDFAQRVAARLGVPFYPVLRKTAENRPQKEMENSAMQVRNLLGTFALASAVPDGPVLLLDDVVDSGWTLTLLGVMLRLHGSGPVYPLVLAKASPRGR